MVATTSDNEKLVIPAKEEPTLLNGSFFKGWFFGGLIGALAAPLVGIETLSFTSILGGVGIATASSLAGGVIGGSIGKNQMQRELVTGKEVKNPTFWNKNIFKGLFVADVISTVLLVTSAIIPEALGASTELAKSALQVSHISTLGLMAWGLIAGGFSGKEKMQQEFNQAITLKTQSRGIAPERSQTIEAGIDLPSASIGAASNYKNSVSAEEAQTLNVRMKTNAPGNNQFSQEVLARRAEPETHTQISS